MFILYCFHTSFAYGAFVTYGYVLGILFYICLNLVKYVINMCHLVIAIMVQYSKTTRQRSSRKFDVWHLEVVATMRLLYC